MNVVFHEFESRSEIFVSRQVFQKLRSKYYLKKRIFSHFLNNITGKSDVIQKFRNERFT